MKLSLGEISAATSGRLKGGSADEVSTGVSTDTRTLDRGEVFFALRGKNFDGHDFLHEASSKGAAAAVVESAFGDKGPIDGLARIEVEDTLRALGDAAAYVRKRSVAKVVAITGSSGKTTTKEMVAAVLSGSIKVLKTRGNMNNLIGMPLTLLGLDESCEAAVIELGISETSEMKRLAEICTPDVALITNVGRAHLEGFGTIEDVAREKGELFASLRAGAVRVVNADDELALRAASTVGAGKEPGEVITFGKSADADVRIEGCGEPKAGSLEASFNARGESVKAKFASPLVSNAYNGASAIAVALALGIEPRVAAEALSNMGAVEGRMCTIEAGGFTILDDTYNANPESMAAALDTLGGLEGGKVAILGDMLELGAASREAHREAGAAAAKAGARALVAIGEHSSEYIAGAADSGLDETYAYGATIEAVKVLGEIIKKNDIVLVKGSRGAGMETLVAALREIKR